MTKIARRKFASESSLDFDTLVLTIGQTKFSMSNPEHFAFFAEMEALLQSVKSHVEKNRKEVNLYNLFVSSYKAFIASANSGELL